jgi:hypothetical protein
MELSYWQVGGMARQRSVFRYRLRSALLAFLALGAMLAIGRAVLDSAWWNGGVRPMRFDPVAWRLAHDIGNHRTTRSQMIGDLLGKHDFHGWSRKRVTDLLGTPDWDPLTTGFAGWDVAYHLGLERGGGFSLDDECLVFRFDKNDRVIAYATAVN